MLLYILILLAVTFSLCCSWHLNEPTFGFWHNGSKQGKEAEKHFYIYFAIFGEERESVLRMDEASAGGKPGAPALR